MNFRNLNRYIQMIFLKFRYLFYWLKHFLKGNKINLSLDEAREILENYSSNPNTSCFVEKTDNLKSECYDCSIIIPTYNNEIYLKECLDSVLNQTTRFSFQVIVINDGSTDNTKDILIDYINIDNFTLINQDNKGFSGARNAGIDVSRGKYLMFVDSDDILSKNAIENLLSTAFEYDADIVAGNFRRITTDRTIIKEDNRYKDEQINPIGKLSGFPWGKVFKASLFYNLRFPEGYWYEDSINAQIVYPMAKSVFTISNIVYEYTNNPLGISNISLKRPKSIDSLYITEKLFDEKRLFGLDLDLDSYNYFLRMVKLTYRRTYICDTLIAKCIFELQCNMFNNFKKIKTVKNSKIELALKNKDFRAYLRAVL